MLKIGNGHNRFHFSGRWERGEGGVFYMQTQLPENEVMSQQTKSQLAKKPMKSGNKVFGATAEHARRFV